MLSSSASKKRGGWRAQSSRQRAQWIKYQNRIGPERLIFIDENRYGCATRPAAHTKVPHRPWKTTTFLLAALRLDRIDAP
jgi:hypothetical protein